MNQGEALLRAVVECPDDDVVRLAYADWLNEAGDSHAQLRAEFIRVQIEIAAIQRYARASRPPFPELDRLADMVKTLSDREKWLRNEFYDVGAHCVFRRGFVEVLECTFRAIVKNGPELLTVFPTIREVTATDREPEPTPVRWHPEQDATAPPTIVWGWFRLTADDQRRCIDSPVFRLLDGHDHARNHWKFYADHEAAHQALARALLAYCKNNRPKKRP